MTSHNRVVQSVKEYFETLPIAGRVIDTEEPISFGTKVGGFADVVLRSNARFAAIAECKNPWDSSEAAKAQLKSYLCATGTLFGVLAIGKDPRNWVFCENQGGYYFKEVRKDDFEKRVSNWKPTSSIQYREDTARQWEKTARQIQKSIRKWQVASIAFAFLCVIFFTVLMWPKSILPLSTNGFVDRDNLYQVVRIIDGDTVEIEYEDVLTSVQLIGVNAPETVHPSKPVEPYGKEATVFLQGLLLYKFVYFEFDRNKRDRYNRLLAYIYRDSDDLFVNIELIRQGYGKIDARSPFKYMKLFQYHESQVRTVGKGLYGVPQARVTSQSGESFAVESKGEVYVTRTGKKYHREGCTSLRRSKIPISLVEAKQGYGPCGRCNPPR